MPHGWLGSGVFGLGHGFLHMGRTMDLTLRGLDTSKYLVGTHDGEGFRAVGYSMVYTMEYHGVRHKPRKAAYRLAGRCVPGCFTPQSHTGS